jgi:anti-anti-sigma factor
MTMRQGEPPHIVVLGGDIDIATGPAVRRSLMAAIRAGHVHLIADMAAVRFIDARGFGVLVAAANAARGAGGDPADRPSSQLICRQG